MTGLRVVKAQAGPEVMSDSWLTWFLLCVRVCAASASALQVKTRLCLQQLFICVLTLSELVAHYRHSKVHKGNVSLSVAILKLLCMEALQAQCDDVADQIFCLLPGHANRICHVSYDYWSP